MEYIRSQTSGEGKYYFSDLGLRNARINFRQFEQTHSMENVIYNQSAYSLPDEAKRKYDENGILTVNIYEFLLNPRSIDS